MRWGVFTCPECRRVQLADRRFHRVSCVGCRRSVELASRKFYYDGEDEAAARAALLRVSAQLGGMGIEDYAHLLANLEQDSTHTVEDALTALSARASEFSVEDLAEELARLHVKGEARRILDFLLRENRVYEPRSGRFRLV